MNALDLNLVNAHSDYKVWLSPNGKFVFTTDYGILYAVDFLMLPRMPQQSVAKMMQR